jgi:DNA-binding NtrC family response regulator
MRAAQNRPQLLDLLIVDDEPHLREMLAGFCAARGFRVAEAHDGPIALQVLGRAEPPFPVVIADLHMPGADGFAVVEAALRANASCYVIVITGYATIDVAVRAVKAGAYDFLAKPFALGQLDIVLSRIRDRMALETENRHLSGATATRAARRQPVAAASPFRPPSAATTPQPEIVPGPPLSADERLRALEDRVAALERALLAEMPSARTTLSGIR